MIPLPHYIMQYFTLCIPLSNFPRT